MAELGKLLMSLDNYKIYGCRSVEVSGVSDDSREIKRGNLFVAIRGLNTDGHEYISDAIHAGANVVVGEASPKRKWLKAASYVKVSDSRRALSLLASAWYGHPSGKLKVIGVTGTDGKTTTASMIYQILQGSGRKAGLISTVSAKIGKKEYETGLHVTSPNPLFLQKMLSKMVESKCKFAVVEVTSHGISQKRIEGVNFDISVLTNISHEHLDYHKSFEKYKDVKISFLDMADRAVVNKDDDSYEDVKKTINKDKITTYSVQNNADFEAGDIKQTPDGLEFSVKSSDQKISIKTKIRGSYNVANMLACLAATKLLGIDLKRAGVAAKKVKLPEGRMQEIKTKQKFKVFIDFAHTPNALKTCLSSLRRNTAGRLISVFGSAGERDKTKRFLMGEVSASIADISIFTAEDPRSEDVSDILEKMARGAKKTGAVEVNPKNVDKDKRIFIRVPDRGEAIVLALQKMARNGDCVVVAGKGHEKSMAYDHVEHPWSDHVAVRDAIKARQDPAVIVLADLERRMNSSFPKVLQKIAGRPMVSYTLQNLRRAGFSNIVVVVGYKKDKVISKVGGAVEFAVQEKRLGTAHATGKGLEKLGGKGKRVVVSNGDDSAFYEPETIKKIIKTHDKKRAVITFVSLVKDDPEGFGRVLRDGEGKLAGIVEEKDADANQKKIKEVNDGLYAFDRKWLSDNLKKVKKNRASGEYYLVDLVKIAIDSGEKVEVFKLKDPNQWQGVNTKKQLKRADKKMRKLLEERLQK